MTKVLVIEDEATIRANIADILELEGFEVLQASDGQQGLENAKQLLPDLVICDVMMPGLDGYEVVKALRQTPETSTIPFIFLTARASKADFRHGMVAGSDDYLTKPFTVVELLEAIQGQLAKQAALTQKHQLDLKQAEADFNQTLCYDPITQLPNQFLLREQFNRALEQSSQDEPRVAVLCVHLHHLNRLSTTLNSSLYSQFLKLLADYLRKVTSPQGSIAHRKENQFVILLSNWTTPGDVAQIARTILSDLARSLEVSGQKIYPSVDIGISLYPQDGNQIETLVRDAEIAVQAISPRTTNTYQFYRAGMSQKLLEKLMMENDLRSAWEESNFEVFYQPQVHTQSCQIIGSEALLRCLHPQHGLLSPSKFIPLAEETGLIIPIGEWVTRIACQQAKLWQTQGCTDFRIAINLSPRQLNQPDFGNTVTQLLQTTQISPESLEFEITESSVMENLETAIPLLKFFKDQGIRVAVDDFGTGYSSLSYLKHIPLDTLKIDQAFIFNIETDRQNREIVKNIIQLAHSLGLKALAEGVETEAERDCLHQLQCDELQGYLFSRPLCSQEFGKLLKTWPVNYDFS